MALTEVVKEAIWHQGLMDDLRIEQYFLKVNCDSMSAIYLAKNQVYHASTNHIDVRYHFVRDILEDGDSQLKKIHTKNNVTGMLMKVFPESSLIIARTYSESFQWLELNGAYLDELREA